MSRSHPTTHDWRDEGHPGPCRIVYLDADQPFPELHSDGRYRLAFVVGCRDGVPVVAGDINLDAPRHQICDALAALQAKATDTRSPAGPAIAEKSLPAITVVVPTIVSRIDDLRYCLDGLAALDYPDYEVVLADNRRAVPEDDALAGLLAPYPNVRSVRAPRPGISAARNAGVAAARHDIIAFTDDDVRVDPAWLRGLGTRFAGNPSTDAVTGLILPAELETPAQVWFERYHGGFGGERTFRSMLLRSADAHGGAAARVVIEARDDLGTCHRRFPVYGIGAYGAGANMSFRRSALDRIGGFDVFLGTGTPSRGGEDLAALIGVLWTGGEMIYEPCAIVRHKHRAAIAEFYYQLQGNGIGFTAMLTALVAGRAGHLYGLVSQLPTKLRPQVAQIATRLGLRRAPERARGQSRSFPRRFVLYELWGYVKGPFAYLRSRRSPAS